jgi:protein-S-isoprenylcysteine O-methyltransferase Ste14
MTITVDHRSGHAGRPGAGRLGRILGRFYGVVAYAIFLAIFLYAIGFVSGLVVPKSIDTGTIWPPFVAFCIDVQLLCLFAVQHGGMARPGFRRMLAGHVSPLVARSTYVLCSSLMLILLFAAWQPLPAMVWQAANPVTNPWAAAVIQSLSLLGWLMALHGIFLIGRFELFSVKQVLLNFAGRTEIAIPFRTPGLYGFVRHPIYLGLMVAFWAAPVMTAGHFLFASLTTAFMFAGIWLEERDLLALFGDRYRRYQKRVAMLLPGLF